MPRPKRRNVQIIELGLVGVPEPLSLRITKKVAQRLDLTLSRYRLGRGTGFFVWDTAQGSVAISLRDVQYARFTEMDPAEAKNFVTGPDEQDVEFRFRGRPPFVSGSDSPLEAYDFLMLLETGPDPFVCFPDPYDRPLWARVDELVYMSVPRWMAKEGVAALEAVRAEENARLEAIEAAEQLIAEVNVAASRAQAQPPAEGQ
jgi:hypothetical protein